MPPEWESISLAGAFLLGAVLATIAVLRVVRAVSRLFEDLERRRTVDPKVDGDPATSGRERRSPSRGYEESANPESEREEAER